MQKKDNEYIKADMGLLMVLLLITALVNAILLLALSLVLNGKAMLYALLALSLLFVIFTIYSVVYFLTVKYEKGDVYIKISSGIIIRKYTYISTDMLPFVAKYHLPFKKGFSVIRIFGGTQVIFSTKVL